MKSVVKPVEKSSKPFPKLMINEKTGLVVLFTDYSNGTVVKECQYNKMGTFGEWEYSVFTDFTGTVTLSND